LDSRLNEISLLEQPFIKNQDLKVGDVVKEAIAKFGEKLEIKRFVRFEI
jgi:elongation factor Ts